MPLEISKESDGLILEEKKNVVHHGVADKEEYSASEGEQEDLDHGRKMRRWLTGQEDSKKSFFFFFKSLG